MSLTHRWGATAVFGVVAVVMMLSGCTGVPADVDGTLRDVQGGNLRVGITHNPPWTDTTHPDKPSGQEVRLVQQFADSIDASIVWEVGSEAILTDHLHAGSLDLAVGGFTDDTPWTDRAAITVPYDQEQVDGTTKKKHVMFTVLGENRFLTTLETFLLEHGDDT